MYLIATTGTPQIKNPESLSEQFKSFLAASLEVDVSLRPNATNLLEHPFLQMACPKEELIPLLEAVM